MTTISSTTLEDTNETSYVSPDELMLKELERRDGIYSFIFHELEKSTCGDNELSTSVLDDVNASTTTNTVTTSIASICPTTTTTSLAPLPPLKQEFSVATSNLTPIQYERSATTSTQKDFKKPLPSLVPFRTAFFGNNFSKRQLSTFDNYNSAPVIGTQTSTNTSTLSRNNIPSSYAYQDAIHRNSFSGKPKLFSYMSNCTVRVCLAPTRFSHVSAPLVRNRRHSLKERPEYKQSINSNGSGVPDLRGLFPNDPDVYAPFHTPTSAYDNLNISSTCASTTTSSEMSKSESISSDIQHDDIQLADNDYEEEEEYTSK